MPSGPSDPPYYQAANTAPASNCPGTQISTTKELQCPTYPHPSHRPRRDTERQFP